MQACGNTLCLVLTACTMIPANTYHEATALKNHLGHLEVRAERKCLGQSKAGSDLKRLPLGLQVVVWCLAASVMDAETNAVKQLLRHRYSLGANPKQCGRPSGAQANDLALNTLPLPLETARRDVLNTPTRQHSRILCQRRLQH